MVVIALAVVIGAVLWASGVGRGEPRTLFTVDACPQPSPGPDGDLPLPKRPVPARAVARWEPEAAGAGAREVTALLSPSYPGAHDELGMCQRGEVAVSGSPGGDYAREGPRLGALPGGRREVRTTAEKGRLVIAESVSAQESVPDYGANDFGMFNGWYLTAVDPAPGTYRWTTEVTWRASPDARPQPGTLVVELALG